MHSFLSVAAACCMLAACQPSSTQQIQVTGQAKLKVVPDMVELSLVADNTKPAMKNAVAETESAVAQILDVCHQFIKQDEDIKVSNIATNKDYQYVNNREVFSGYSARQVLEVRLRDIGRIEAFTEALLATRISSISNIRYNHSRADSLQRVVNLMALADAEKTAQKMCEQMNVHRGETIFLSNYAPGGERMGGVQTSGNEYDLNLYSKSFGGRGFKMTTEILEFQDVAFAGFSIEPF